MIFLQIRSLRYAVNGLQYAGVSQRDWHRGQVLCNVIHHGGIPDHVHCVLVDLSFTSQGDPYLRGDDFGNVLHMLSYSLKWDGALILDNCGEREFWTSFDGEMAIRRGSKWVGIPKPPNPYLRYLDVRND